MNGGWIQTFTGQHVYPLAPEAASLAIEDIAHGLSLTCRFTGQCKEFYSVAQHSLLVASILPDELKLAGLLHDASEAYLSDIHGIVKPHLGSYRDIEARFMLAIAVKFGLSLPLSREIKLADRRMLATEVRDLIVKPDDILGRIDAAVIEDMRIELLSPKEAEGAFLEAYWKLCK